jgi:hypothetical protein
MFSSNEFQDQKYELWFSEIQTFLWMDRKRVDHREEILIQRKDRKLYFRETQHDGSVYIGVAT